MLGIFRKFDLNRFIIIFRFGTDISIYIIIKARLTMRNSNQKENVPIAPEDTNLKTFFTSIRIIGILIAFLLIAGIVLIELEEEGEVVIKRTLNTRLDDTYDEVFKVRACNENACSDWAYFK